ncbi:MAG: AtpZ/AtpI family protein [Gemmatimonadota bacterium]|jgi:F0F1-type ATP synthase assembly protein I|nr:AtpZ/AtpI family protein [Gemmatimonadota bacterium]
MAADRGPDKGMALGQKYFAVGLRFAGGIILFMLGGLGLDRWLHTMPLFTIAGTLLGAVLSFLSVYRELMADQDVDADGPDRKW